MVVYVEYVILDNAVIDFIILYAVAKLLKLQILKLRFLLALVLAVAFAFVTPLLNLGGLLIFVVKLLMGVIIVAAAFKVRRAKQFALAYLCFMFMTFLMGGICYGLQGFMSGMQVLGSGVSYEADYPISLVILGAFVFFLGGKNLYFALRQRKHNTRVTLIHNERCLDLMALVDSGNQLLDEETHLPITFVSRLAFSKLGLGRLCAIESYKQMVCSTVGSSYNVIETLVVDKIIVDGKEFLNARVAVIDLSTKQGCDAIISDKMFA